MIETTLKSQRQALLDQIEEIVDLVLEKDEQYGATDLLVAEMLKVLYPNGIEPSKISSFVMLAKQLEKICRNESANTTHEQQVDAMMDLIGYTLLGLKREMSK